MDDIAIELTLGGTYSDSSMNTVIYATSNNSFDPKSGSYHNLNMALSGLTDSFATAIASPYAANADMGLKNWAGYDHDANVMLDVIIENTSPDQVDYDLEIAQNPGPLGGGTIVASGSLAPGANLTVAFLNTLVPAYTNFASGPCEYFINARFADVSIPPARCRMNSSLASDTDGFGTGTTRSDYVSTNGPFDVAFGGPFNDNLVSGTAWNASGQGISWNKRTSFHVIFN